jgi:hypothetical protein
MSNVISAGTTRWTWGGAGVARQPAYQAYQVLHFAFVFRGVIFTRRSRETSRNTALILLTL